jgi:hypothetical protein
MSSRMHIRLLGVLAAMLSLSVVAVQPDLKDVTDPTKPPPGVIQKMTGDQRLGHSPKGASGATSAQALAEMSAVSRASRGAAPASAASAASAVDEAQANPWSVTSIRIDLETGVGVALLGDDLVTVGDTVRGMKVVAISASEVQLKGPDGVRKLVLPDVNEQSRAKPDRAAKRGRKENK